jgi:ferredoxin-NADP reductase
MSYKVKLLFKEFVTHDVKHFILEKPEGFKFIPGQATELSMDKPGWQDKKRPFTFTSLNSDPTLEFTIKCYADHNGVTKELHSLNPGDNLLLEDPFGALQYKGPGIFLAAGAGITPFIAILRNLKEQGRLSAHTLIFSNKTKKDIILEKEFKEMFTVPGTKLVLTLSREEAPGYESGRIDENLLKNHIPNFKKKFYICGPKAFVAEMKELVVKLGGSPESLVFEE